MASGTTKKCVNCALEFEHVIVDWNQRYFWCAECWREYLEDFRSIPPEPSEKPLDTVPR